jgi:hypothetical protein
MWYGYRNAVENNCMAGYASIWVVLFHELAREREGEILEVDLTPKGRES